MGGAHVTGTPAAGGHVGEPTAGLLGQAQRPDRHRRELGAGQAALWTEGAVGKARQDAPRRQRLRCGAALVPGDVREGRAGGRHRRGLHVRVLPRQARSGGGRDPDRGVAHAVEAVLPPEGPLCGHQGVQALLRGHLAGAGAAAGVEEAAVGLLIAQQPVQGGMAVLHKPGIVQGDAQLAQGHQHLGRALRVGRPAAGPAAVIVLDIAEPGQRPLRRVPHRRLVLIFRQGLEGHAGDVGVGVRAAAPMGQVPAAAVQLTGQDLLHVHLPGGPGLGVGIHRHFIVSGVQGQQRPDGAVDALPGGLVEVPQGRQQIIARHIRGVCADGRQGDGHPGVLRVLLLVEDALAGRRLRLHRRVIAVPEGLGHLEAAAGQAQDGPLAAHAAHPGLLHGPQHIGRRPLRGVIQRAFRRRRRGHPQAGQHRQCQQQAHGPLSHGVHPVPSPFSHPGRTAPASGSGSPPSGRGWRRSSAPGYSAPYR